MNGKLHNRPSAPSQPEPQAQTPNQHAGSGRLRKAWAGLMRQTALLPLIQRNLQFTVFLTVIGILYIWNSHQAEKQARQADRLARELRELKSEYMTLSAQLSIARQQSQVAQRVDTLGLQPLRKPPVKLQVTPIEE